MTAHRKQPPIAVVGVAALFPGSTDASGFWRDILAGTDLITEVPPSHWLVSDYYDADPTARDRTYARKGAFLRATDFDPMAWGVPPSTVPATDTSQLLGLVVAHRVLEDACQGQFARVDRERASVILGVTSAQELLGSMVSRLQRPVWVKALRESGLPEPEVQAACDRIASSYVEWQESSFPGVLGNVVAGRIANRLDLGGTNCVTDAACASTFAAVSMGVNELRLGESDLVITGGVDTMNDIFMYMCFSKTPALSPTEDCRPFSDRADGTMLGEGIGMVALKRLEDAERDGDRVYAVLCGVGSSSDGRAKSVYAPLPAGQAKAIRRAYAQAGFGPETVGLVEAHGTGTKAGDAAEFEGLRTVFDETARADRPWCALGSVKSQIGHTKAAAGAAGLFKAVMALHHKVLPPTIKVDRPNPALGLDASPFYISTATRPWVRDPEHPRRAGVSSFGFGGSNFHLVLEEYEGPAERPPLVRASASELVLLAAASADELVERAERLQREAGLEGMLVHAARESQESFDAAAPFRLAIVARSEAELGERLGQGIALAREGRPAATPTGVVLGVGPREGGLGFLFPGQGSQYPGMGGDLAVLHPAARSAWDLAARIELEGSTRLHDVAFPYPVFSAQERDAQRARLQATEWAQPALAAASLACLRVLRELGLEPDAVAGHSFGEVTALHAASALSAEDLLAVARRRGELMAEAASIPGAMTAVSADARVVSERIARLGSSLVIANHNAPGQLVLSGTLAEIAQIEESFTADGIRVRRLDVATAFHSALVSPAMGAFERFLRGVDVHAPAIDVYADSTARPYPHPPEEVRATLAEQIAKPVRFVELVEAMHARGIRTFVEVGPDAVLTSLAGRILEGLPHLAIALDRRGQEGGTSLHLALARLAAAGIPMDLAALWRPFAPTPDPRKKVAPRFAMSINGANYAKPYPPQGGTAALPLPNAAPARPFTPAAQRAPAHAPELGRASAPPASVRPAAAPRAGAAAGASARTPSRPSPATATPASAATHTHTRAHAGGAPGGHARVAASGLARGTGWLEAYGDVQRETADAHAAYQRSMAESHVAFLRMAESSIEALASLASAGDAETGPARAAEPGVTAAAPAALVAQAMPKAPAVVRSSASATPAPPAQQAGTARLTRAVVTPVAAPAAGLAIAGLRGARRAVVSDDGAGVAAELVRLLDRRGIRAEQVTDVPPDADAVVFLGGLRDVADPHAAMAVNAEAFRAARSVAPRLAADGGLFVTVQDTGGDLGHGGSDRAWLAGLTGLVKCAALEWPKAAVRAIDVARGGRAAEELARVIADELLEGGGEVEVGIGLDGRRVSLAAQVRALAPPAAQPALAAGDLVVVTGGARGVTAASAIALARATGCHLLLVGRTPLADEPPGLAGVEGDIAIKGALLEAARKAGETLLPAELRRRAERLAATREVRGTLAAVAACGARARYAAVDVTDAAALGAAIASARAEWGPVRGIVHGAGVLADRLLAEKTDAQFASVFDTKVRGLAALLEATQSDPLRLLVLFASVAGRSGNRGQADYAMANEVLARVAAREQARRGGAAVVKAIDWGPWQGGMVDTALAAHFAELGVALVPLEAGARALVDEVLRPGEGAEVEVVIAGAPTPPPSPLRGAKPAGIPADAARAEGPAATLGAPAPEVRLEVEVGRKTHPELDGHRVKGAVVLPAAYALEWLARAALAVRPGARVAACRALRVLRGIRLGGFDAASERLELRARALPDGSVEATLLGDGGSPRYAARFDLEGPGDVPAATPPAPAVTPAALTPWSAPVYGGVLFHEGAFRLIRALEGASPEGLVARLSGSVEAGLEDAARVTDPALVDGALQLALLWSERVLGGASLPTGIASLRLSRAGAVRGEARAVLTGRSAADGRATCDVVIAVAGGVVLELLGIETHRLPAADAAGPA